jgi:UDP-glucuronate 4-epimerase
MTKTYLVTGVGGFIGFSLTYKLLNIGASVVGIDNLNSYYDQSLKVDRIEKLKKFDNFDFKFGDIKENDFVKNVFSEYKPEFVINLAAQAGVRYSLENPQAYIDSNIVGFMNILEACRNYPITHLIYASSSSVYGGNKKVPFSTNHNVDHPVSLYAATKKSNELMAHTYSHLFRIPTTGLRFFTVYGPWGRPDMAYFSFTKNIIEGKPIKVFNNGQMERDFTYIDDIVESILRIIEIIPQPNPLWNEISDSISSSFAPYKIYNIGNSDPVPLLEFIQILERKIGRKAKIEFLDMQLGDVIKTFADVSDLEKNASFKPITTLENGIDKFVDWYLDYYQIDRLGLKEK